MKLNEFKKVKKVKIDEVDTSSLFGNYGSAALRTGVKSLFGKSTLSTQDQIAKDQFVKSFMSKAAVGLQDAIKSGWVDQGGANQPAATVNPNPNVNTQQGQGATVNPADAIAQKRIAAQKAQAAAIREPGASEGPKYAIDPNKQMAPFSKLPNQAPPNPAQTRQQKQQAAAKVAQQQMGQNPVPTAGKNVSPTPAQNRQQKLATAAQTAQGQMNPVSKLPADQFAKSATNVRQQQQGVATQNAQGQMNPVSKLPADQFAKSASNVRQTQQGQATTAAQGEMLPVNKLPADQFAKSADNVRQQQQTTATQTAQQQMAEPTTKAQPTQQQPGMTQDGKPYWDPATGKGSKYDGVTGETTPEWQKELDKQEAARLEKVEANRIASQAAAAERDAQNAELVRQGVRQNPSNVTNNITQTTSAPDNVKISTADPAEIQSKMQAKIDAMKEKNPKLAAAMQAEIDSQFKQDKPDNTIKMPKPNVKPRNAGKNAFGQMAQNLGGDRVAEGSRFDKLNYLFESIIAEAEQGSIGSPPEIRPTGARHSTATPGVTKKSISQWVVDFFKKFMKGEDITSDPTIMQNVTALAKELEQNYTKDKGKTTIPKLADLAWSATHSPGEKDISQDQPEKTQKTNQTGGQGAAGTGGGGGGTTNIYNVFGQGAGSPQDAQKAKSAYQQIQSLLKGLTPANKQKILASLQKELTKTPPTNNKQVTPNNTVKVPKIKGAKAGLPTADEEAKFQQRIQQAQQK